MLGNLAESKHLLMTEDDAEMKEMAREEVAACERRIPELEESIKLLLVPKDPEDSKNAILEIRGGTGGDEAALFAGDLFRMYAKYCEAKGWKLEVSSASEGAVGGFKEVVCSVTGADVYGTLKYESGVHRVQRVPATETQGRVHTSAATVAVLPEAEAFDVVINEAFRDWVTNVETTNYIFGTAAGPHPFPELVRDLQRVIGDEARAQLLAAEGRLPDVVVACVGGGSNAIGSFTAFIDDPSVELLGCEAAGDGFDTGRHAASITADQVGVLHGARTFVLQERDGQTKASHSISAGLDYPGVGPEHAWLACTGRASYIPISDAEAMDAFLLLSRTEGIIPAIESSHALAGVRAWARAKVEAEGPFAPGEDPIAIVTVSGRGDKDVDTASRWFGYGHAKLQVIDPSAGPSGVAVLDENEEK